MTFSFPCLLLSSWVPGQTWQPNQPLLLTLTTGKVYDKLSLWKVIHKAPIVSATMKVHLDQTKVGCCRSCNKYLSIVGWNQAEGPWHRGHRWYKDLNLWNISKNRLEIPFYLPFQLLMPPEMSFLGYIRRKLKVYSKRAESVKISIMKNCPNHIIYIKIVPYWPVILNYWKCLFLIYIKKFRPVLCRLLCVCYILFKKLLNSY